MEALGNSINFGSTPFSALFYAIFAFVFYCGNGTCLHFITKSLKHRLQGDKKTLRLRQGSAETGCKRLTDAGSDKRTAQEES